MLKPVIALSSILLGGAVIGFALNKPYVGHHSLSGEDTAKTHREIAAARPMEVVPVSVRTPADSPAEEPVNSEVAKSEVMTLAAVTIRGPQRGARVRAVAAPAPLARTPSPSSGKLNPCSEWRDLGPHSGVRMLCSGSASH